MKSEANTVGAQVFNDRALRKIHRGGGGHLNVS